MTSRGTPEPTRHDLESQGDGCGALGSPNNSAIWGRWCFSTKSLTCAAITDGGDHWPSARPTTIRSARSANFAPALPQLGAMFAAYGFRRRLRNAATIGGNIGHGSPSGTALRHSIARGQRRRCATVTQRKPYRWKISLSTYGKAKNRAPGEFVEAITVPKLPTAKDYPLRCYNNQQTARSGHPRRCCGCINITRED